MVKVLFRPNTANRSQEPPTPVPPSVYTMYVSPIPYEAYDPVMVLLPEIQALVKKPYAVSFVNSG